MKLRTLLLPAAALGLAALVGCSGSSTPAASSTAPHHADAAAAAPAPAPAASSDIVTDAKPTAQQLAAYPMKTCLVSDEKLGEHGKPYEILYQGKLVRFCCDSCLDDFKKDPAKYMTMLDKAAAHGSAPAAAAAPAGK